MTVYSNEVCGGVSVSGWNEKFLQWYSTGVDKLKDKINEEMEDLPGSVQSVIESIADGDAPNVNLEEVATDIQDVATQMVNDFNKKPISVQKPLENNSTFATPGYSEGNAIENLAVNAAAGYVLDKSSAALSNALNSLADTGSGPVSIYVDAGLTAAADLVIAGGVEVKTTVCGDEGARHTFKTRIGWEYLTDWHGKDLERAVANASYTYFQNQNGSVSLTANLQLDQGAGSGPQASFFIGANISFGGTR